MPAPPGVWKTEYALMSPLFLAAVGRPLFGSFWLALLLVAGLVVLLMAAVALAGRWLAATHADAPRAATPVTDLAELLTLKPETLAILAGAVNEVAGPQARLVSITHVPVSPPSVEALMAQWSLEGRRQIYSSHKVR